MSSLRGNLKNISNWLLVTKFIIATGYRALYPLAPVIATHLKVDIVQITALLASFQFVNIFVCAVAPSAQSFLGLRTLNIVCVLGQGILLGVVALATNFTELACAVVLFGVAKGLLWPTILATANSISKGGEEGKVVAKVELSWGLSSIIGLPSVGFLMSLDFKVPFIVLGVLCFFIAAVGWPILKEIAPRKNNGSSEMKKKCSCAFLCNIILRIIRTPMALSVFFTSILLMSSMYVMFVSFGLWLTEIHGLGAAGIGAASFTIGAADLLAEIALIKVLKHYPGRKFLVVGFTFYIVTYVFLAFAWRPDVSLGVGLAAVFFCFFQFEMLVVGNIGLVGSIVLKESKNTVDSTNSKPEGVLESMVFGAGATGSVIGSILSTVMWNLGPSTPGILGFLTSIVCLCIWLYTNYYSSDRIKNSEDEKGEAEVIDVDNVNLSPPQASL